MIKNSQNIFIILGRGLWNFVKMSFFAFFSLFFSKKNHTMEKNSQNNFPFLSEILEK